MSNRKWHRVAVYLVRHPTSGKVLVWAYGQKARYGNCGGGQRRINGSDNLAVDRQIAAQGLNLYPAGNKFYFWNNTSKTSIC
ncbi:MAG: hypothetical protein KAR65_10245 [Anaerolineales bacterium]|nr:hypothetical protein [Anaerolineales bacterium]